MKTNHLMYTILYMGFVLVNIVIVTIAIMLITMKGQKMADAGAILLFLEAMVFLLLRKEPNDSIQEY